MEDIWNKNISSHDKSLIIGYPQILNPGNQREPFRILSDNCRIFGAKTSDKTIIIGYSQYITSLGYRRGLKRTKDTHGLFALQIL